MNVLPLDYDACAFSTDGRFVASAVYNRLIVKTQPFAGPHVVATASYAIDGLWWNVTSDLILCTQFSKGVVQVYDVCADKWIRTIRCGYFKFVAAEWISQDNILLTLEFHMALAVFNLMKNSIVYIEIPKPIWPCAVFDSDGTHMFVVSKINGYEKLLMMSSRSLNRVIYIQDIIGPCNGLNKSPDNRFVCVFNNKKLAILNFYSGNVIGSIECFLLNTVSWSPNSKYLALGCSLGDIVVLTSSNEFNVEFKLSRTSLSEDYNFFLESNGVLIKTNPSKTFNSVSSKIAFIVWSFDCKYLSTCEENSKFLCIWEKYRLICAVELAKEIKKMQWCQAENKLSVAYGTDLIFFWTEGQTPILQTSPKLVDGTCLLVSNISWSLNNRDMILSDGKNC
ncbi:WD repeat-containing protein WRAP73-like [Myzus persicae]|uniref:WD repeat-containing protein WRAP73-like n=1 Tax=Myzus persicae TaxID=13164 RepID=UPI000B934930|nr:WD repeat-containing protein WRAP73-like [Myzus persicae]